MSGTYNPSRRYLAHGRAHIEQQSKFQDQQVCGASCYIPCEQINLVVEVYPKILTSNDQNITLSFIATNVTSQTISQPIIIVSSLLGNILLSSNGISPGQTITISRNYSLSNMGFPSNTVTDISYVAYGTTIPGGYAPGDRLSKVITTTSNFQSSPTGGPTINSSGEIIDGGNGIYIISMSFTNTSNNSITGLNVPLNGVLNTANNISIIRNPNNLFQLSNNNLVLASGQSLLPGVRNVVVLEGTMLSSSPYCNSNSCAITYTASSSAGTNPNLRMILGLNTT
jgi:hypothetical protein